MESTGRYKMDQMPQQVIGRQSIYVMSYIKVRIFHNGVSRETSSKSDWKYKTLGCSSSLAAQTDQRKWRTKTPAGYSFGLAPARRCPEQNPILQKSIRPR